MCLTRWRLSVPGEGTQVCQALQRKVARYAIVVCAVCAGFGGSRKPKIVPDAGTILAASRSKSR